MVALKIKEYLEDNGIKQRAVATKAGINEQEFSEYMNGRRRLRADTFFNICDALNVSPELFHPKKEATDENN